MVLVPLHCHHVLWKREMPKCRAVLGCLKLVARFGRARSFAYHHSVLSIQAFLRLLHLSSRISDLSALCSSPRNLSRFGPRLVRVLAIPPSVVDKPSS
eukprot:scaffold625_cov324-Pavlova_lutheri.AAC.36